MSYAKETFDLPHLWQEQELPYSLLPGGVSEVSPLGHSLQEVIKLLIYAIETISVEIPDHVSHQSKLFEASLALLHTIWNSAQIVVASCLNFAIGYLFVLSHDPILHGF